MPAVIWRMLIAGLIAVFVFMALPLLFALLPLKLPGALLTLINLCIAAALIFYVITGKPTITGT